MASNWKLAFKGRSRGKAFIVAAIGVNAVGLANLELGTVQIAGNAVAAGVVLTASLGCLIVSLFHPIKELKQEEKEEETGRV
jgi:hypothetical protein